MAVTKKAKVVPGQEGLGFALSTVLSATAIWGEAREGHKRTQLQSPQCLSPRCRPSLPESSLSPCLILVASALKQKSKTPKN